MRTATGVYRDGRRTAAAGPWAAGFSGPAGTWLDVTPTTDTPLSPDGRLLTERLREEPAPARALVGGPGARLTDTEQALTGPLPLAMLLTVAATLVLLFLYTRSLLVPVKAVLLNGLSLAATFGIIVAVFQQGRLESLLGHMNGPATTDVIIPAVMFCTAFGLSMDYEVFLLSRILEEHRRGTPTGHAVAVGLQRTGRLFTSAALIFAVVMASLAACDLIMLQFIGFGLAVAVVIDCTLVRALLVPAIMSLAGKANWWPATRSRRVAE
ncbi:MMPL family transporter [Streptomyces griseocarneus]|nr:MMPL family transporter [Streptomyces griseocarneus]